MSDNNLISMPNKLPAVKKDDQYLSGILLSYEKIDSYHYAFDFSFDETAKLHMEETDKKVDQNEFIDTEFESTVPESEKPFYMLSAASGALTGVISALHLSFEQLKLLKNKDDDKNEKDKSESKNEWKSILIHIAHFSGYEKNDYSGACAFLIQHAAQLVAKSPKGKECIAILADHPSYAGLIFSIVTQFSEKAFAIDEKGEMSTRKLPEYYVLGQTNKEKLTCAILYWCFNLAFDSIVSARRILDESRLPKQLTTFVKELAKSLFGKSLPKDRAEAEKYFSEWLQKVMVGNDSPFFTREEQEEEPSSIDDFIKHQLAHLGENSLPLIANDCIVFALYTLINLCRCIKENKITNIADLNTISPALILPLADDRVFSKMCMISSLTFVGADIASAAVKALVGQKIMGRNFAKALLYEINIPGLLHAVFAVKADCKFWGDDIHVMFQKASKNKATASAEPNERFETDSAFDTLVLDAQQARMLYSLENICVLHDISDTEKPEEQKKKSEWLKAWRKSIVRCNGFDETFVDQYFVKDEELIYQSIYALAQDKANWQWFYLLTQELSLFKPYSPLGCKEDKSYKKLKVGTNYVDDLFVRKQTIVSQSEVNEITNQYKKYTGYVTGSTQKAVIGVGAAVAVAAATGGIALTFAPGIAAIIAGEAVAGLQGIALANASLAFIGGGALAAGGLGVAGGTAIITGGGALLGLVSTGGVSAASILLQTPSEYLVRQCAKLLTFCKCVLQKIYHDVDSILLILKKVESGISNLEKELEELKKANNDLDKEVIKKTSEYLGYLKKCRSELQSMTK